MGCDGGSIPRRAEMVKTKGKTEQIDDSESLKQLWTRCYISKEPLTRPIVACKLGRLYNKESVVLFLLHRREAEEALSTELAHIKSLKSLITCNLTDSKTTDSPYFTCPITGRDMNGKSRFFVITGCGCVLSEQAIKEFPNSKRCLVCEREAFNEETDLVLLYPKTEELEKIRSSLDTAKGERKQRPSSTTSESILETSKAQILFEEIKAASSTTNTSNGGLLKRSKVTDSIYINNINNNKK